MGWTERERKFLFFYIDFMIDRIFHRDRLVFVSLFLLLFLRFLSSVSLSLFLSPASGRPVWFSEWLSPLRLRGLVKLCAYSLFPRVTGDAHSRLPSTVLLLADPEHREAR